MSEQKRTATSHESRSDQLARLREMAYEPEGTWDLSTNDRGAIASILMQRETLLAALRRMCGMYGAYSRRLAPLLAEDEGTMWTFERANELALEAIAKAEGS